MPQCAGQSHGNIEYKAIGKIRIPPAQCQHSHEQQRLDDAFYWCFRFLFSLANQQPDVVIDRADARDAEVIDKHLRDVGREEGWERRAEVDVLHAEMQQG